MEQIKYLIERTDDNRWLFSVGFGTLHGSNFNMRVGQPIWSDDANSTLQFDSKDEAEEYLKEIEFEISEGGCDYCRHGSFTPPVKVTEHIFIDKE